MAERISVTQRLNEFGQKWGAFIFCMSGVLILVLAVILQVKGVQHGYFYHPKLHTYSEEPLGMLYYMGGVIVLLGFRRKWVGVVRRWINAKRKARRRKLRR